MLRPLEIVFSTFCIQRPSRCLCIQLQSLEYGATSNSSLIRTGASIPNPATLGIQLDTANFEIFFMGTDIRPVHGNNVFLPALGTLTMTLEGAITSEF